jgi:hypothetical protein
MNTNKQNNRPKCILCDKPSVKISTNKNTKHTTWRKYCSAHHNQITAAKHGLKSIAHITAMRAGFGDVTSHRNSSHPSRKYRKDYCENRDGRLGFVCTYNTSLPPIRGIEYHGFLDVDHINGNPDDNRPENLQTLCKCCHAYKTLLNNDSVTPGRKTIKNFKMNNPNFRTSFKVDIFVNEVYP